MARKALKPSGLTDEDKLALARRWASGWSPPSNKIFGCLIYKRSSKGFGTLVGNSAWPINGGRCRDDCDAHVVIPARFRRTEVE